MILSFRLVSQHLAAVIGLRVKGPRPVVEN